MPHLSTTPRSPRNAAIFFTDHPPVPLPPSRHCVPPPATLGRTPSPRWLQWEACWRNLWACPFCLGYSSHGTNTTRCQALQTPECSRPTTLGTTKKVSKCSFPGGGSGSLAHLWLGALPVVCREARCARKGRGGPLTCVLHVYVYDGLCGRR